MKKILVLLFSVILSLLVFTLTGCGKANEIVENSLTYNIDTNTYSNFDDIDGSFKIKIKRGKVANVKFTVKGFDSNGNELWSEDFDKYYRGLEPQDEPHTITFSYSHRLDYNNAPDERTTTITVTDIWLVKEKSNKWMGWTFGLASLGATANVIALFVLSKLKSTEENALENSEEIN